MRISIHQVGPFYVNCYVVQDEGTGKAVIIDPGGVSDVLAEQIERIGADNIKYILLTHFHFDHTMGLKQLKKLTEAPVAIHKLEAAGLTDPMLNGSASFGYNFSGVPKADMVFEDGNVFTFGDSALKVMHTPGHSAGSSCFVTDGVIFSGDTLFRMGVGRTDLPTGDTGTLVKSVKKLYGLDGDYEVYPGHDDKTTLEYERVNNYFVQG